MAELEFKIAPGDDSVVGADGETLVIGPSDTVGGWCSCGYKTIGWPNDEVASERLLQHKAEHETGKEMEPIESFRERLGLVPDGRAKAVFPAGAKDLVVATTPEPTPEPAPDPDPVVGDED